MQSQRQGTEMEKKSCSLQQLFQQMIHYNVCFLDSTIGVTGSVLCFTPLALHSNEILLIEKKKGSCKFNEAPQMRDLGVVWQITCLLAWGHKKRNYYSV